MKQSRELIQRISIPDSVKPKSRRSLQQKSLNSRSSRKIQNGQVMDNQSSIKQFSRIIEENIPQSARTKTIPDIDIKDQNMQQSKIIELNHNFSQLSSNVQDIKHSYSQLKQTQSRILQNIKSSTNSRKLKKLNKLDHPQIHSFLTKKQQQQEQRQKRRLSQVQKLQKIKADKELKEKQDKQALKQQRMQSIKKYTFSLKDSISKSKHQEKQKKKHAEKIFDKYRNSIPLFQIKQKQNLQNQIKRAEQIRQYLKKYHQSYSQQNKNFKPNTIQQHQKWYFQQIDKLQKQKNLQKLQVFNKMQEQNQKFKKLYRGKATEIVLDQIKENEEKREMPFKIREKIKDYQEHRKQNYIPKKSKSKIRADRANSSSLDLASKRQNNSTLSYREIKRYKYIHGVSYGQIVEERPLPKTYKQSQRSGNGYLQFMKALPKKRTQQLKSQFIQISMPKPRKPNILQHNRVQKPSIKLNSQPTRLQINMVLQQLRVNDKKIKDHQTIAIAKGSHFQQNDSDRRQINQQILLNVQKKLNLLHKLQDNSLKT